MTLIIAEAEYREATARVVNLLLRLQTQELHALADGIESGLARYEAPRSPALRTGHPKRRTKTGKAGRNRRPAELRLVAGR